MNLKIIFKLLNNNEKNNQKEIIISSNSSNEINTFKKEFNLNLENKSDNSIDSYCEALKEIYAYYLFIINSLNNIQSKGKIIVQNNMKIKNGSGLDESVGSKNSIYYNNIDSSIMSGKKDLKVEIEVFYYRMWCLFCILILMIEIFIFTWG